MNLRSPLTKLLLALSVLAVLSAHLFGIGRSFLCDCSGRLVTTASDHCHGPHDGHCEENAHPDADCFDEGDAVPHVQVEKEFRAPTLAFQTVQIAPVLRLILWLNDATPGVTQNVRVLETAVDFGESPPPGVAVARTVVLRI